MLSVDNIMKDFRLEGLDFSGCWSVSRNPHRMLSPGVDLIENLLYSLLF